MDEERKVMSNDEIRAQLIEKLSKAEDEKTIKALSEALKAIEMNEATRQKDLELDLKEIELRNAEERAEKEIKSANKRSFRQLAGEWVRGIATVAGSAIGVVGGLIYLKTSIEAERDPDDPVILKPWQRNKPKF